MPQTNIYTSAALETFSLVTGSTALTNGANLVGVLYDNYSSSAGWVQLFDGYAQPTSGAVPLVSLRIPATTQSSFGTSVIFGLPVKKGIVVALSSTGPTYTPVSSQLFITAWWNKF